MSRTTRWASLILAVPLAIGQAAQDDKKAEDKKPAADRPLETIASYHDGTKVRMVFVQEFLEVETKYGKLKVPTADVRRIDFGFRVSPEIQQKLDEALANLTKDNFQLRETAAKDLVALGRLSYPALLKLSKGQDLDTTRRIEDMLKAIRTKIPADQLKSRTEDLVHTHTFTIAGKIEGTTVKAKTEHFGEVALKLVDLRNLQSSNTVGEVKVSVDAMTYGGNNVQWMDTGYTVQPDVQLSITASGEVDLYGVQSPGSGALSGPDGNRNYGRGNGAQYLPGQLIGRIGEDGGEIIVIGRKFEKVPTIEGKLYLRIAPLPGSGGSTGSYAVNVSTGNN